MWWGGAGRKVGEGFCDPLGTESGRKDKLLQVFYYRSEDEIGGTGTGGAEREMKRAPCFPGRSGLCLKEIPARAGAGKKEGVAGGRLGGKMSESHRRRGGGREGCSKCSFAGMALTDWLERKSAFKVLTL